MSTQADTDANGAVFYGTKVFAVSRPGIKPDEMLKGYDDWNENYDEDMLGAGYVAPVRTAEFIAKYYAEGSRADVRILDVGCGTGLGALELRKLGFTNIDGLDPSESMLDMARKDARYVYYIKEFLTADPLPNIPENSYDCVAGSGCLAIGHMPSESMLELIRLVKPGGYIVITTRVNTVEETDYYKGLEPLMKQLEEQGKWKRLCRDVFPRYYKGKDGITYVFQVL